MPILSDVSDRVSNLLGTDPHLSTAEITSLAQTRYERMYEEHLWSRSIREFSLSLVASTSSTSANTVTVTSGSSTVTSAGTPFTTSPSMVGYQIRIGAEPHYFFINSVTSTSAVEIGDGEGNTVAWPRATDTESSWTVFQHRYQLPADCDDVIVLSHNRGELEEMDGGRNEIDFIDPDRSRSADPPTHWWYDGEDRSAAPIREIGVSGFPSAARILRGQYARQAPTLAAATVIDVPVAVLVYGTAADAASMLVAKEASEFWVRLSTHFNTLYEKTLDAAIVKDNNRKSQPYSIGRSQRNPGSRDHSIFPANFVEGF